MADPNTTTLSLDLVPFPDQMWTGDINALAALLIDHLVGVIPQTPGELILGQVNGTEPNSNVGLWLNGNVWYNWSDKAGKYLPFPLIAGGLNKGTLRKTTLVPSSQDSDVVLYLPDQNGATLATYDDVLKLTGLNPTQTLPAAATVLLNFDQTSRFVFNLNADIALTLTGGRDGQDIDVYFITAPSTTPAWAVTWTGFYGVSSGALSTTDSTHYSITRATVHVVGDKTYVEWGATWTILTTADALLPMIQSIVVNQDDNVIILTVSKLLKAVAALDVSKFYLTVNGSQNIITSAVASGSKITLTAAQKYPFKSVGSLSYSGTDAIDVSGNTMAPFQPTAITVQLKPSSPIVLAS